MCYLFDCLAAYSRIRHLKLCNFWFRRNLNGIIADLMRLDKKTPHKNDCHNHPDNTKRISDSTPECRSARRDAELRQCLLYRAKCRCIGGGSTEYPHHVRQTHRGDISKHDSA